jgi:rhamnose transport system substrate-binding protein
MSTSIVSRLARLGLLAPVLVVAACGSTKNSTDNAASTATSAPATATAAATKSASDITVAFLPKQLHNPYFTISDDGGKKAVEGLGAQFKRVGPSDTAPTAQVPYINTLTTQKVGAIAISANDANAIVPALKKAMDAGIKVVTYDSDTAPDGRNMFIN